MTHAAQSAAPLANQIPEACRRLGIGRSTLYRLIAEGEVRAIKIGGRTLIPEADLKQLVEAKLVACA